MKSSRSKMLSAVIVAGGNSVRYGANKLQQPLFDGTVLEAAVNVFRGIVDKIVVVGAHVDGTDYAQPGATRLLSVLSGLKKLPADCTFVAVHDGARPFVSRALVKKLFDEVRANGVAVPYVTSTDTAYRFDDGIVSPLPREQVFCVQTPQVFDFPKLMHAFETRANDNYTDESSLFFDKYHVVKFVEGERTNKKITFNGDLPDFRTGNGFDVHPLLAGNGILRLGGVDIPFEKSLVGHSDADVVCHAICDALLSAVGLPDIGHQFPPTDDKYKGIDSMRLLATCVQKVAELGYEVSNCTAVVICQQPKLAPYLPQMSDRLSKVLGVDSCRVTLSATTTEHLGAIGNGDGIACQADVLVKKTY